MNSAQMVSEKKPRWCRACVARIIELRPTPLFLWERLTLNLMSLLCQYVICPCMSMTYGDGQNKETD